MNKKWEEDFNKDYDNATIFLKDDMRAMLAKQRTQLLARVREEVIGEFREETDGYINRDYLITETTIENNLIKEQLEKLRELADD